MSKSTKKITVTKPSCLIYGSSGRMGIELIEILKNHPRLRLEATVNSNEILAFDEKHTAVLKTNPQALTAVLQGADFIIDFSSPEGTKALTKALSRVDGKTVLVGTTGISDKEKSAIRKVAETNHHKILMAGNTSLGVASLAKLARSAARMLESNDFDIEILETHHRMKVDAPSGTALLLAKVIQSARPELDVIFNRSGKRKPNTIGIHSIRGGGVIGEHTVRFISANEELSFSHNAFSRSLFASGALQLISELDDKVKPGIAMELFEFLAD